MTNQQETHLPTGTMLRGGEHDYRIEKMLGNGSFGITYMASYQDSNGLTIFVAIKEFFMREINGRSGTSVTSSSQRGLFADYRRKFAREAQNLTRLDHKNIIKIIEYFECNNTSYYAMEYLADGSLNDYISLHGPLPEKKVLLFASQIGAALSYMHAQRMLHLDLKPGNIMMRGNDEVVLIDFGLSKCYDANGEPESSTTIGGGTEGYAPLEQGAHYDGEGLPVTMDVYAFGATMYKMLTACKKVYNASYILNAPYGFIASTLTKLSVSQPVANIVSKAMRPYIKDRYQTVSEMMEALGELGSDYKNIDHTTVGEDNSKNEDEELRTHIQHLIDIKEYREAFRTCNRYIDQGRCTTTAHELLDEVTPMMRKALKKQNTRYYLIVAACSILLFVIYVFVLALIE